MKKLIMLLLMGCLVSQTTVYGMEEQSVKGDVSEDLEENAQDDWKLRCIQEEELRKTEKMERDQYLKKEEELLIKEEEDLFRKSQEEFAERVLENAGKFSNFIKGKICDKRNPVVKKKLLSEENSKVGIADDSKEKARDNEKNEAAANKSNEFTRDEGQENDFLDDFLLAYENWLDNSCKHEGQISFDKESQLGAETLFEF